MIETLLSFLIPNKRDGFAINTACELSERPNDVRIVGDEASGLDENAEGFAQFRYVGRRDHAADGVEVFVGKTGARLVDLETKKIACGEPNHCFRSVKRPILFDT